jgi:hypothetical protein
VKVPGSSSQNCAICFWSSVSVALVSSTALSWPMKAVEPYGDGGGIVPRNWWYSGTSQGFQRPTAPPTPGSYASGVGSQN